MRNNLVNDFGNIDIYLFDQLLKGRFDKCKDILDVGCGGGRNLIYFLRNGFNVYGIDSDAAGIDQARYLSRALAPNNSMDNFKICLAEDMPFENDSFDLIICSAVLHFATSLKHFEAMLHSMLRVLKPGGFFFSRLASDIGIEHLVEPVGEGRYVLPDGSERFLVNHEMILSYTQKLKGVLFEPIKTTNVENLRCMTTWCLRKN